VLSASLQDTRNSSRDKLEFWTAQSKLTQRLIEDPLAAIRDTLDVWKVFNTPEQLQTNAIGCGDEGLGPAIGCRCHMPGAGILRDPKDLVNQMLSAGITGIVTHDNCAAARLALERNGIETEEWLKKISALSDGKIKRIRHIPAKQMARPEDQHVATTILVRAMRRVNFAQSPELPLAFNIDGKTCTSYLPGDLLVYLDIAMGRSGFGELFTPVNPLAIVIIGRNPYSKKFGLRYVDLRNLIEELFFSDTRFAKYRRDYVTGRIVIVGFDPPMDMVGFPADIN
jgi:hypothetical protein